MVRAKAASEAGSIAGSVTGGDTGASGKTGLGNAIETSSLAGRSVTSRAVLEAADEEAHAVSVALSQAVSADDVVARLRIDSELRMIERSRRERDRLTKEEAKDAEELQDGPSVSSRSKGLAGRAGGDALRQARAMRRQRRVENEIRKKRKEEEQELTFRPRISERSSAIVRERQEAGGGSAMHLGEGESAVLRRFEEDLRRREARRKQE